MTRLTCCIWTYLRLKRSWNFRTTMLAWVCKYFTPKSCELEKMCNNLRGKETLVLEGPAENRNIGLPLSSLFSVTTRIFTDSLFLHWSWIKTIWGKTEGSRTEATQPEEVTHLMCPLELSGWHCCSKPSAPPPSVLSASFPSSRGLCSLAEELEILSNQPSTRWLDDWRTRRGNAAARGRTTVTLEEKKDGRRVWTKAYPKFPFFLQYVDFVLSSSWRGRWRVVKMELQLKRLFLYTECSLVCTLPEWMPVRWSAQHCGVYVKLWDVCVINYFFNWLLGPVIGMFSAITRESTCLNIGSTLHTFLCCFTPSKHSQSSCGPPFSFPLFFCNCECQHWCNYLVSIGGTPNLCWQTKAHASFHVC